MDATIHSEASQYDYMYKYASDDMDCGLEL